MKVIPNKDTTKDFSSWTLSNGKDKNFIFVLKEFWADHQVC